MAFKFEGREGEGAEWGSISEPKKQHVKKERKKEKGGGACPHHHDHRCLNCLWESGGNVPRQKIVSSSPFQNLPLSR